MRFLHINDTCLELVDSIDGRVRPNFRADLGKRSVTARECRRAPGAVVHHDLIPGKRHSVQVQAVRACTELILVQSLILNDFAIREHLRQCPQQGEAQVSLVPWIAFNQFT